MTEMIFEHPVQPGRPGYVVFKSVRSDHYTILRACPICGGKAIVQVPAQGLWDWEHGTLIQQAFPDLTPAEREVLMSGIHSTCWEKLVNEEDE